MDLERQVSELGQRVSALEHTVRLLSAPQSAVVAMPPSAPPTGPPLPPPPAPAPVVAPAGPSMRSFDWGVETVLRWAGVVLVSLAAIFVVSTAISRGWIGPELQLLTAALAGSGLLAGSLHLAPERRSWALALNTGASVVLGACALATHHWLDLFSAPVAFGLFAATVVLTTATAVHSDLQGSAVGIGLLALLAPLETLGDVGEITTLAWLATLVLGCALLGARLRWTQVRVIPSWIGALLLLLYSLSEEVQGVLLVLAVAAAALIAAVLWASPLLAERLANAAPAAGDGGDHDGWRSLDLRLVAFVPAWVWAMTTGVFALEGEIELGLAAGTCAAVAMALTAATFGHIPRLMSLATLLGGLALSAVALTLLLDGPALMVALAAQAVISLALSQQLRDLWLMVGGYLSAAAAALLAWAIMAEAIADDGFETLGQGFATALLVGGAIALAWLVERGDDLGIPKPLPLVAAWTGTMTWLAAAWMSAPQGLVLISVSWTVMAAIGLVIGLTRRHEAIKNAAMATLAITLGKLVTIDLAGVDVFWRAGLFGVVGVGLIALGLEVPRLMGVDGTGQQESDRDHRTQEPPVQVF